VRYDRIAGASGARADRAGTLSRYKAFEGLEIPSIIAMERGASGTHDSMVIERVVSSPPLDGSMFTRPAAARWRNARRLQAGRRGVAEGSESPAR
jgi:hypothetical protein